MIVHDWGEIEYLVARKKMQDIHTLALRDKQNHLILCSHPNIFTVGSSEKKAFSVNTIKSDRGGSITCHSPGQNIYYFCFEAVNPALFYRKVLRAFEHFFIHYLPEVYYNKEQAGFYIQNRKIASLGFRYAQGVSLHGVALNVDVDLDFHSLVPPCDLEGIMPTSLHHEGVNPRQKSVNSKMIKLIAESFQDAV